MEKKEKFLVLYLLSHYVAFFYLLHFLTYIFPDFNNFIGISLHKLDILFIVNDLFVIYILDNFKASLNEKLEVYSFDIYINSLLLLKSINFLLIYTRYLYPDFINYGYAQNLIIVINALLFLKISVKLIKLISFVHIFGIGKNLFFASILDLFIITKIFSNLFKSFTFHYIGSFFIEIHKVNKLP